jgi:hypothetical protein
MHANCYPEILWDETVPNPALRRPKYVLQSEHAQCFFSALPSPLPNPLPSIAKGMKSSSPAPPSPSPALPRGCACALLPKSGLLPARLLPPMKRLLLLAPLLEAFAVLPMELSMLPPPIFVLLPPGAFGCMTLADVESAVGGNGDEMRPEDEADPRRPRWRVRYAMPADIRAEEVSVVPSEGTLAAVEPVVAGRATARRGETSVGGRNNASLLS